MGAELKKVIATDEKTGEKKTKYYLCRRTNGSSVSASYIQNAKLTIKDYTKVDLAKSEIRLYTYELWKASDMADINYYRVSMADIFTISGPSPTSSSSSGSGSSSSSSGSEKPFLTPFAWKLILSLVIFSFVFSLVCFILMRRRTLVIKSRGSSEYSDNSDDRMTDIDMNDYRNYKGVDSTGQSRGMYSSYFNRSGNKFSLNLEESFKKSKYSRENSRMINGSSILDISSTDKKFKRSGTDGSDNDSGLFSSGQLGSKDDGGEGKESVLDKFMFY